MPADTTSFKHGTALGRRQDMRVTSKLFVCLVLVLALLLGGRLVLRRSSRASPAPQRRPAPAHRRPEPQPEPPQAARPPNPAPGSNDGFYIGRGGQRVYVNFATTDPVLRSLLQSVMDENSAPGAKGKEIFLRICAACHQRDGEGKDGVAPPLMGSEWVLGDETRLVRLVLNGLSGPVRVNGRDWNLVMPPWRANLDDDQVAVVLSYVRSQLGTNRAEPVTSESVAAVRKSAGATPETAAGLLHHPPP